MTGTAVSTELTPQELFQKQIADRLRADVGSLIPNSILTDMINTSIQNMFFTRTKNGSNSWNTYDTPSWFEREVQTLLEAKLKASIDEYMKDNTDIIHQAVLTSIKEKTPELMATYFTNVLTQNSYQTQQTFGQFLKNLLNIH